MLTKLVIIAVMFTSTSLAATISGTVTSTAQSGKPPPRYVERSTEHAHHHDDTENAPLLTAVTLEALDIAGTVPGLEPGGELLTMAQAGTAFEPNLLIVPAGGVVSFPNHDPIFHNVFSYSSTKKFDLGRYPKGETRTVTFDDPGIVRVFCEIHPSMYAAIVVTESPWYAVTSAGETFKFTDLPAGKYRILAVNSAGRHSVTEVTISPNENRSLALELEN